MAGPYSVGAVEGRLLDDARAGGRSAFDELMGRYLPEIRKFVAARVENRDVDDVVQEILLATWKAIPLFDGRSRFRTWLFGICQHKVKDHYRSRARRQPEMSLDAGSFEPLVPSAQEATDLSEAVKGYMRCLSASQSEVIELYYQQNLTLAEVASVLDRNLNTVKYQFCQAHVRLAKAMREGGLL